MPAARDEQKILSTLRSDGSRRWIHPRLSPGRWLNRRRLVGYGLIALFVTLPHLRIGGKPPLLLDVVNREFTFFGTTLYPTDTFLLALLLLVVFLSVFFITALFGRLWCGWACPQTVYMELVFRPIERFFEGAPGHRRKPGAWRKPAKFATFFLLAFLLANTFLAYFVGTDALRVWMTRSPLEHPISFAIVAAVTGLMLFDFGFFREQLCIVACPYGRMQSVMLDRDSLVVGYDPKRGEPRGKIKKRKGNGDVHLKTLPDQERGDCIDCHMCVTTCPTGIDIRDGLQLECVNCTQCIDACDSVMDKIGKPRGLIRYSSQRQLEEGKSHWLRPRVFVYPAIILVLLSLLTFELATREAAFVSVLRGPGLPYQQLAGDRIGNIAKVKIHDRTDDGGIYRLELLGVEGGEIISGTGGLPITVEAGEMVTESVWLTAPADQIKTGGMDVTVRVTGDDGFQQDIRYRMLGPASRRTPAAEGGAE
jgi:cytochrome c oxidase accessory protein FixG